MRWWIGLLLALVCATSAWADPRAISIESYPPVSVGTASTTVLAAKTDRRFLLLINDSDTTIYCTISSIPAVVGRGARLNANGGSLFMDVVVPSGGINCINGTGSKNLIPLEG